MPRKQNIEVEYVKSVHTVSRWIHEIFERPDLSAAEATIGTSAGTNTDPEAASVAA